MHTNNINQMQNGGGNNATSGLTPIVTIEPPAPPAISVVTFRWDSIKHSMGAPDR